MSLTAQEVFVREVRSLPLTERLRLASMILEDVTQPGLSLVEQSDSWTEQDRHEIAAFSLEYARHLYPEDEELV